MHIEGTYFLTLVTLDNKIPTCFSLIERPNSNTSRFYSLSKIDPVFRKIKSALLNFIIFKLKPGLMYPNVFTWLGFKVPRRRWWSKEKILFCS